MSSQLWSYCNISDEQVACIQNIREFNSLDYCDSNDEIITPDLDKQSESTQTNSAYDSLLATESSCRKLLDDINLIILSLNMLSEDYNAVTNRSNSLMKTCEDLLEQQVL